MMKELDSLFDCGWEAYYYDERVQNVYGPMRELADKYYKIKATKGLPRDLIIESFTMKKDLLRFSKELAWAVKEAKESEAKKSTASEIEKAQALFVLAREAQELSIKSHVEANNNHKRAQKTLFWARISVAASIFIALFTIGSQFAATPNPRKIEDVKNVKTVESNVELNNRKILFHQTRLVENLKKENALLKRKLFQLEKEVKSLRTKEKFAKEEDKNKSDVKIKEASASKPTIMREELSKERGTKV